MYVYVLLSMRIYKKNLKKQGNHILILIVILQIKVMFK